MPVSYHMYVLITYLSSISRVTVWWVQMLGMPTTRMEVKINRMSKQASPSKRMLMELTMEGLTNTDKSHILQTCQHTWTALLQTAGYHTDLADQHLQDRNHEFSLFYLMLGLILTCQTDSRNPKLKNLIINLHLFYFIPFSSEN